MLLPYHIPDILEAGCDEAGRGPLAGSVFAAAVVLDPERLDDPMWERLNDSKQLSEHARDELRPFIEQNALAWAVAEVTPAEIDRINILQSSLLGMRRALDAVNDQLTIPQSSISNKQSSISNKQSSIHHILVDGNRWKPYWYGCTRDADTMGPEVPATTVVHGDATYLSIAAASILAKTWRDEYMRRLAREYPAYGWEHNMGYPTRDHYAALRTHGPTPYHRMTFRLTK